MSPSGWEPPLDVFGTDGMYGPFVLFDTRGGEINLLLDVIAADQQATLSVQRNFKQVVKEGDLRLHPVIAMLVDAETLVQLGAKRRQQGRGGKTMIWLLVTKRLEPGPGGYGVSLTALDGDIKKVELLDKSVDIGKWEIEGPDIFQCGRHVVPTHLPTRLQFIGIESPQPLADGSVKVPDYMPSHFGQVVSERFRDLVEKMDPGAHQFVPVTLEWPSGKVVEEQYFWLFSGNRLFPLDFMETKPKMRPYPEGPDWIYPHADGSPAALYSSPSAYKDWHPVFRSEIIGACNVFCTGDFNNRIFISDDMKITLDESGFSGFYFRGPFRETHAT